MINISPELKEAFNPNDGIGQRSIDWVLRFAVVNNEAFAQMQPSASEDELSRIAQTLNDEEEVEKLGTLELNRFVLDGTFTLPPLPAEQPSMQIGLVSPELSGGNGDYLTAPTYTVTTVNDFKLIAVTLCWGHYIPRHFTVEWSGDGVVLKTITITGNKEQINQINEPVEGVDQVRVTVLESAVPFRKMRLAEFIPGGIKLYTRENSDSVQLQEVTDPINERVTASDLKITAENFAREYNIFSPDGIYKYFQNRQRFTLKIGALKSNGEYEYIDMGRYYLRAPSLKGNLSKIEFSAVDLLGVLQDTIYAKGTFRSGTFASFAQEVANDAGVDISFPDYFSNTTIKAYIGSMSHAQAFRLIAQATNTVLCISRKNIITFLDLQNTVLQTISEYDYRMDQGFSPSDDDSYNTVTVEISSFAQEGQAVEIAKIEGIEGSYISGVYYADNAEITTSAGKHYVKYDPSVEQVAKIENGALIISGKRLINTVSSIQKTVRQDYEPAYIYEIGRNPLIQAVNADRVAEYMLNLKVRHKRMVKVEYRGYPYFEIGDIIDFNAGGENTQPFFITSNKLNLGGGMTGTLDARER